MNHERIEDDLEELAREVDQDPLARAAYQDAREREDLIRSLIKARVSNGQSMSQIARLIGVAASSISDWETGRVDPRLSSLQRYARAVGLRLQVEVTTDDFRWR